MNNNNKIKQLTENIRQELGEGISEPVSQFLNEITELTSQKEETEEEKKLYEELGISEDLEKKQSVKEVQKLAELKGVKVNFKEKKEGSIFLQLEQKDKQDNFAPELVLWNFAQELTFQTIGGGKTTKTPQFWTTFEKELEWVKQNVSNEYFSELEALTVPSLFPTDKIDIDQILVVDLEEKDINKSFPINSQLVDKAWKIVKEKALELGIRTIIHYNQPNYTIIISYAADNPQSQELEKLMIETPLQLENELLKAQKEQLPTPENFEKVKKQVEFLKEYLRNSTDTENYEVIKDKIDKIK